MHVPPGLRWAFAAVAIAAAPVAAYACSQCLCGTPFPADALGGVVPMQIRYGIEDRYLSKSNALEEEPGNEEEHEHRMGAFISWRAVDRLALLGRLPYNFKEIIETPEGEASITRREQGLGDAELLALIGLAHGAGPQGGTLGAVLGVVAPTGPNNLSDAGGERLDEHLQPGSGAWSGSAGLNLTLPGHYGTFLTSVLGRMNGENASGYRYGNAVLYNAGFFTPRRQGWSATLQANGRTAARDDLGAGVQGQHSGGTVVYLSPGLRWQSGFGVAIEGLVQVPVIESLYGIQDEHTTAHIALSMDH